LSRFALEAENIYKTGKVHALGRAIPQKLDFKLLSFSGALMLDVEIRACRDAKSLPGNLDGEGLAYLNRISETAELRCELGAGVALLQISVSAFCHD
jgi:hypothetical protein